MYRVREISSDILTFKDIKKVAMKNLEQIKYMLIFYLINIIYLKIR